MSKKKFVSSTNYVRPYRPLPVRLLNLLGRNRDSNSLQTDALIAQAKQKTGLDDLGDESFRPALDTLIDAINEEAELTVMGKMIQKSRLLSALIQRLRVAALLKRHPEIHHVDPGRIIMITGLQRTGTTLLHRLLHSHPQVRGISGAEGLEPVPENAMQNSRKKNGRMRAKTAERLIAWLSPDFITAHPIDHEAPEEDVMLLDLNFMSQLPEATLHVPSYSQWLEQQDHTRTYEYLRTMLKILCWQWPTPNRVLKTPHHLEYLDVFSRIFPDATIVQTHRDPRKTLPSFCSLVAHSRAIFSDHVDPEEIGWHWGRKTRRMVDSSLQYRASIDEANFVDVSYYDLIENPVSQLRRIYQRAGIEFTHEAEHEADLFLQQNPQHRFGRHAYQLEDFGLSEQWIEENFSEYRQQFGIPFE